MSLSVAIRTAISGYRCKYVDRSRMTHAGGLMVRVTMQIKKLLHKKFSTALLVLLDLLIQYTSNITPSIVGRYKYTRQRQGEIAK